MDRLFASCGISACLVCAAISSLVTSARAAETDTALPANASVDQILDALDQSGKSLKEFDAKVRLTEGDPVLADYTTRAGKIWLQKTDSNGGGRIHVLFDKKISGRIAEDKKTEYLLDGEWLTDRDYDKKLETKRQILKPGQKMNLFKLGEGPFPLLIGQDKEEVHKQFDVSLIKPAKDDPANTLHLRLVCNPDTRLARHFSTIDVWVDRKIGFPGRIDTVDANKTREQKTFLTEIRINPQGGLSADDFKLPAIDEKAWDLHTEAYKD